VISQTTPRGRYAALRTRVLFAVVLGTVTVGFMRSRVQAQGAEPTQAEVAAALRKAVVFFHDNGSKHGGYVWRYSRDLTLSEGEGETDESRIWVQPPGTPSVGDALLDAYEATGDEQYLEFAREAATALVRGQLQSGGWFYSIEFDPAERVRFGYRDNRAFRVSERKKNRTNITTLDDDTTQSALRFLIRMDEVLEFEDREIHEAVQFALEALLEAQFPNGGWKQNGDRYPEHQSTEEFPVIPASYPADWSRKWLNDWRGIYYLNDDVAGDMLRMMLLAWETYDDERFLRSARRTGDFLILAQMPDPQPAWAQQYDAQMQPVWDRKFEPPAISGQESQFAIRALFALYAATDDEKYLAPIPRAIEYLEDSELPDGRLARFYELQTNRPLYFQRDGDVYHLTYDDSRLPSHYAFIVSSKLDALAAEYARLKSNEPPSERHGGPSRASLATEVRHVIDQMDSRGAWVDRRGMRGFGKASPEGVIQSETFIRNVDLLCRFLTAE
jgi:hypothetical protein